MPDIPICPSECRVMILLLAISLPLLIIGGAVACVVLARRIRALREDLREVRGEVEYHGSLWNAKLYGKRDGMLARATYRR
jgi:hypothetical protein